MQATPDTRQILLAAAPDDPLASELVTALRTSGKNVLVANTIALASRADEFAICIIVLRPGQWRTTPVITTAMRSNPPYMVPILAEPMSLPRASWSTEAINVKEPLSETVHELDALISKQLQASPKEADRDQPQQTKQNVQAPDSIHIFRTTPYKQNRRGINFIRQYALLFLVVVLVAGFIVYYAKNRTSTSTNISSGGNPISNLAFGQSYKDAVPGGCSGTDKNWWDVGAYFKTLGTPTVAKTNTTSKETPTPYVVHDPSIVATCQRNDLQVQHNAHYDTFAEVFFQGDVPEKLPQHFSTQITATALNASNTASFTLGVRNQSNGNEDPDRGYGDDNLIVGVDGSWKTVRFNDVTDQVDTTFTRGFVKPSQTITLGAEVDGPRITFSINGQKLLPIVDTTYPSGYGIGFGLADSDATSPPSAVYSHFFYQSLTNTNLAQQPALATATTETSQIMHTTYIATTPGFGCDQGTGQWEPVAEKNNDATASCRSNGLALSQDASAQYTGYEAFYGLNGFLPTDYSISMQIDISQLPNGCAGMTTRRDTYSSGYNFRVCYDGYWAITRYPSNGGDGQKLADGSVPAQTSYTMVATSQGNTQKLSLDGGQTTIATVQDSTLQTTDHIDLTTYSGQGTAGTAVFSNFIFTPIF